MSDFKFVCPECGQKILGDVAYRGRQIACPGCQKMITVPGGVPAPVMNPEAAAVAAAGAPPIPKTAARSSPKSPAAAGRQQQIPDRFSGLAMASLLCSVFVPLGSIPGIICGHLAKARMRRNIFLVGEKMANAGLLISYCVLMAMLALGGTFIVERWQFRPVKVIRDAAAIAAMQSRVVDEVIIGENEGEHQVQGQMLYPGHGQGKAYRAANHGGWFRYTMKVLPQEPMTLNCRYWGDETRGHEFDIAVDGQIIATQTLKELASGHFCDMEYKIPASLTRGKTQVTVEFQAHPGLMAGGLYGCQMLKR